VIGGEALASWVAALELCVCSTASHPWSEYRVIRWGFGSGVEGGEKPTGVPLSVCSLPMYVPTVIVLLQEAYGAFERPEWPDLPYAVTKIESPPLSETSGLAFICQAQAYGAYDHEHARKSQAIPVWFQRAGPAG